MKYILLIDDDFIQKNTKFTDLIEEGKAYIKTSR